MKNYLLLSLILFISACKPAEKVVEALTSAILEPVTLEVSTNPNLGEKSVGAESTPITVTITNNSSDPITKLNLNIGNILSIFNFNPDSSGIAMSPGYLGTCASTLAPHQKCTYNLIFIPRKAGKFEIPVHFTYENLIEPGEKSFIFSTLTGEPAALTFTNDISKYDFGVLEQTIADEKTLELEIQNVGGLTAHDVTYPLTNTDPGHPAFRIVENRCKSSVAPQEKCKIIVGYKPLNNNYSDQEVKYSGKIAMTFKKDSSGKTDKLNAFLSFTSSTIEAKFSTNYKTVDFGQIIAGNNLKRSVKITNNGYNIGIIKSISFLDASGTIYTTCSKSTTQKLECNKSLYDFPFIIEDNNNCLGREVKGNIREIAGESCYFDITYWPSRTYQPGSQAAHNFKNSFLSLTYDSRWLEKTNIVTKNKLFDVTGDFISTGKIVLSSIMIEDQNLSDSKITLPNATTYEADLGRIAKTSDASMDTYFKITLKNIGESPATLSSLKDGALSPHEITDLGFNLNSYYRSIKYSSCAFIAPGATCNFSYSLSPVVQATSAQEDSLMYDNVFNALKKYKNFIFSYQDGSTLDDDGTIAINANIEIHLIAKLIAKGYLAFVEPLNQTVPPVIAGNSYTKIINLKNVGTGDIFAISHHPTNNFFPKGTNAWPYRVISWPTPLLPSTKDCYAILYPAGLPLISNTPDPANFLAPGQSCSLAIEIKSSETLRDPNSYYTTYTNHSRLFAVGLNNTTELWRRNNIAGASATIAFNYFDGDANVDDPLSVPFGYLKKSKDMMMNSLFQAPPNMSVSTPLPTTSALLGRPALSYPAVTTNYPVNSTLSAYTTPAAYFESTYFNSGAGNIFTSSSQAITHVKAMGILQNDIIFHMGTFPVGTNNYAQFNFYNSGGSTAKNVLLSEEANATSPIIIDSYNGLTTKPFPIFNIASGQAVPLRFKFSPTIAGIFSRCYQLDYDNQIGNIWGQRVCVYGEAVATSPKFKIEYQDIDVAYDSNTGLVTETPTGIWTPLNSPLNVPLNAPLFGADVTSVANFSSVKGSSTYALKLFRFTNIGSATATKFNYTFLSAPSVPTNLISEVSTRNSLGANPTCGSNMTISMGAACEFYIKYKPISTSGGVFAPYLGIVYDIGSNLNQYVSQTSTLQFSAIDPAKLLVYIPGVNSEAITDWSNPLVPLPQAVSWPININNYSMANTHIITTSNPTTTIKTNIQINNTSNIKASFLSMNPSPDISAWNTIFSNSTMTIKANRYCFYGDDEFNSSVPATEKGFNVTTVNKCFLQLEFSGDVTFQKCSAYTAPIKSKTVILGGRIQATCNPYVYPLTFYNYKRSSTEKMSIHLKGFIEPNRSVAETLTYQNVDAKSTTSSVGSVTFTWPLIAPSNSDFGPITKYRIYYSTSHADLKVDNIFYGFTATPILNYFDTTNAGINTATIANLAQGKYYFFRVVALRNYNHPTYGNLPYVSIPSNLPILTLPIPSTAYVYNHEIKSLIDKAVLPITGSRSNGISACATKKFDLNIIGSAKTVPKLLVNTTVWNYIAATPAASTGYPGNEVGTIPHWLSDTAYNMKTSISLYDGNNLPGFPLYDSSKLSGNDLPLKVIYQKTCSNLASCDQLFKVVGGDDVDLYYLGTLYTTDAGISAYYRCYGVILCPTNTSKKITDATCTAP